MLHSSTKKLIDRLAEMTELGKLDWTEGEDGAIVYSTEGYSVVLSSTADQIVITSIDGKELERAEASDLSVSQNDEGQSYSDIVATMTSEATRIALGTETAISTLLAGMAQSEAVEAEPEMAVEAPEDAINETTALTEEAPEEVEADAVETGAVETEPESEIETATEEDDAEPIAAAIPEETSDVTEATELEATEASEESDNTVASFGLADTSESDDVAEEETALEPTEASDALADDFAPAESESELTEAVARLADEVNGRDETGLEVATATAVGAVAVAAGLSDDDEATEAPEETLSETDDITTTDVAMQPEGEAAEDEAASVIPMAAPVSTVAYIPFGSDDEGTPVEDIETPESVVEIAASEDVADAPSEPEIETAEPETVETSEPSFVAVDTALEQSAPAAVSSFNAFTPEPQPEVAETPEPSFETVAAVETSEATPEPVSEDPEAEPVAEAPAQSYSLSGIGAGFGLGALAAKTEASGIPGPSSAPLASEKIVIDATDDVLPEPEGQSTLPPLDTSNGISFGKPDTGGTAVLTDSETDAETDTDSDILKPRTRFNPWD